MYNLTHFTLRDMTACGTALRKIGAGAETMEDVANRIVQYLYQSFLDPDTHQPSLALVRLFKTHSYAELEPRLQAIAQTTMGGEPASLQMKCLTLLATTGQEAHWNSRYGSQGHQTIPLVSPELVAQSPMISQLIQQLGLDIRSVVQPDPELVMDLEQRTFNVFHVAAAPGSPFVPAQAEFVQPYGVQSVLGFGGMLPSGNLLAIIMFSKTAISRDTADMFKTLALNAKMALLPFEHKTVFTPAIAGTL